LRRALSCASLPPPSHDHGLGWPAIPAVVAQPSSAERPRVFSHCVAGPSLLCAHIAELHKPVKLPLGLAPFASLFLVYDRWEAAPAAAPGRARSCLPGTASHPQRAAHESTYRVTRPSRPPQRGGRTLARFQCAMNVPMLNPIPQSREGGRTKPASPTRRADARSNASSRRAAARPAGPRWIAAGNPLLHPMRRMQAATRHAVRPARPGVLCGPAGRAVPAMPASFASKTERSDKCPRGRGCLCVCVCCAWAKQSGTCSSDHVARGAARSPKLAHWAAHARAGPRGRLGLEYSRRHHHPHSEGGHAHQGEKGDRDRGVGAVGALARRVRVRPPLKWPEGQPGARPVTLCRSGPTNASIAFAVRPDRRTVALPRPERGGLV
jgi:hypothetical protein